MKKHTGRRLLCLLRALLMTAALAACSGGEKEEEKSGEALLPISVNGVEIRVGETTVQSLLDQGINVHWIDEDYNEVVVDPSQMLEANAYYTGGSINVSDNVFAHISFVTDEEAVPLGEAVIARLEFYMHAEEDQSVLEKIQFDGVPVPELTREAAGEKYPDWSGDEVMWLKYGLEYKYDLDFDMTTGALKQFAVERKYDVDWSADDAAAY